MRQRGTVEKRNGSWSYRYRDSSGRRRRKGGYRTKGEALRALSESLRALREGVTREDLTLQEWVDEYLELHQASERRLSDLDSRLRHVTKVLGSKPVIQLTVNDIKRWRQELPPGVAYNATNALRQVLAEAVNEGWLRTNVARAVKNPEPKAPEVQPFRDWDEVQAVAEQLPDQYLALPILGAGAGLRPEELRRIEWQHVDWDGPALVLPLSVVKARTKQRRIPLTPEVFDTLVQHQELTGREKGPVFTTPSGLPLDLKNFRNREWLPALKRAGVPRHRILDLRHSFCTWALAKGMPLHDVARYMGTSVRMIDRTYGHLAHDSDERALQVLGSITGPSGS